MLIRQNSTTRGVLYSQVNFYIGSLFLLTFALAAGFLIWRTATSETPTLGTISKAAKEQAQYTSQYSN